MPRVFVYGALMIRPDVLAHGERASVADHAVRFTMGGVRVLEPSFAALEDAPGETAWGVVVDFDEARWRRLRRQELTYVERAVTAKTSREDRVPCIALFAHKIFRRAERPPSARYAGMLLAGAEHHRLPSEVVERYRALAENGTRWSLRLQRALSRR